MSISETFCPLPWVHLSTEANTKIRPCCIHQKEVHKKNGLAYHATDESLSEIFQSDYMKSIRQSFREQKKLDACHMCWNDEANGKESKRQLTIRSMDMTEQEMYDLIKKEPKEPTFLQLIITNQCNLKCRTCNPVASTKWIQEANDRGLIKYEYQGNREIYAEDSVFRQTQEQWYSNLEYLELMGGEPFLHKDLERMLDDLVRLDYAKKIKVFVSTNGTLYPEKLIKRSRGQFRFFGINLSIDGINERYNYMRHGGQWSLVSENIKKFYAHSLNESGERCFDHTVGTQMTISWMNILYVPEVFYFFRNNFPQMQWAFNLVYYPQEYNPVNLPEGVKKQIRNEFEKYRQDQDLWKNLESILKHIENSLAHPLDFKVGLVAIYDGDRYRKESYPQVFPEMYELIKNDWQDMLQNYKEIKTEGFKKGYLMIDKSLETQSVVGVDEI